MSDRLNFIDISGYQRGLDLEKVFANNDLDGVIVKATGGTSYVQSTCDPWVQKLMEMGKLWGFYHFFNDDNKQSGAMNEAAFFVKNCENYFGVGMPFLDYEGLGLKYGTYGARVFLEEVYKATGVKPGIYMNLATLQAATNDEIKIMAEEGYPLWLAQYGSNKQKKMGDEPWQKGSVAPYEKYTIHQWTSNCRLDGYSGALDADYFYGTAEDWKNMLSIEGTSTPYDEGSEDVEVPTTTSNKGNILEALELAAEAIENAKRML